MVSYPFALETRNDLVSKLIGTKFAAEVSGLASIQQGSVVGIAHLIGRLLASLIAARLGKMIEHHHRAHDNRERVREPLSSNIGGRAVHCLEYRSVLADIGTGDYSEPPHQPRTKVADDIPIKVLHHDHIEARGVLNESHARGINNQLVVDDLGIPIVMHRLGAAKHEAIRQFHDVGLMKHRNSLAASSHGVSEGKVSDPSTSFLCCYFEAGHHPARDFILDAGIQALGVLAHYYQIDALESRRYSREGAHRADSAVKIQPLAHGHIDRGESAANWCGARALQCHAALLYFIDSFLRQDILEASLQGGDSRVPLYPLEWGGSSVEDATRGMGHLWTDAISGNQNYLMTHASPLSSPILCRLAKPATPWKLKMNERSAVEVDCLVIGGGAAGMFALRALEARSIRSLLIERTALGDGQTSCSQGILHSGTKYALSGIVSAAAACASAQVSRWTAMMSGQAQPDLRAVEVISDNCWLWRTSGLTSALVLKGASMTLAVKPEAVGSSDRPAALQSCPGDVLRLPERVIDPCSLLRELHRVRPNSCLKGTVMRLGPEREGVRCLVRLGSEPGTGSPGESTDANHLTVTARGAVLAAGAGNASLLRMAGRVAPAMQLRPLRQGLVQGESLPQLNGHCIDGARTRLTVTSGRCQDGTTVWHIGGELAESGASMNETAFGHHLEKALRDCLPGLDLRGTRWANYLIDRAEKENGGCRPDDPAVEVDWPICTLWPTKLVLAPQAAEVVASAVAARLSTADQRGLAPLEHCAQSGEMLGIASPPWDCADWRDWP